MVGITPNLDIQIPAPLHNGVELLPLKDPLPPALALAKAFQQQHRRPRDLLLGLAVNGDGDSGLGSRQILDERIEARHDSGIIAQEVPQRRIHWPRFSAGLGLPLCRRALG